MISLEPTANGALPVTEPKREWLPSANGNENRNGAEIQFTLNRIADQSACSLYQINNRVAIVPVSKPRCLTADQIANGHDAIARQDAADMACLCGGNDDAMKRLIDRHAPRLRRVIAKMLRDENEAADVVEETFIRVHRHREQFDLQAKFTSWLYTIALNQARNRLRSRNRQPEFVPLEDLTEEELEAQQLVFTREAAPDVFLEKLETMCGFEASLASLPAKLREPLELFACGDCSQVEIAARLNCSVKAIESRLYHARKQLRQEFDRFLNPRALLAVSQHLFVSPFNHQHKIKHQT